MCYSVEKFVVEGGDVELFCMLCVGCVFVGIGNCDVFEVYVVGGVLCCMQQFFGGQVCQDEIVDVVLFELGFEIC